MTDLLRTIMDIARAGAGQPEILKVWRGHKIMTNFVYPPIPLRSFDWSAWSDSYGEEGPTGEGATEAQAVAALIERLEEGE